MMPGVAHSGQIVHQVYTNGDLRGSRDDAPHSIGDMTQARLAPIISLQQLQRGQSTVEP